VTPATERLLGGMVVLLAVLLLAGWGVGLALALVALRLAVGPEGPGWVLALAYGALAVGVWGLLGR
jgi:multisubunit Na+/H+ antiporter MnhF subunit